MCVCVSVFSSLFTSYSFMCQYVSCLYWFFFFITFFLYVQHIPFIVLLCRFTYELFQRSNYQQWQPKMKGQKKARQNTTRNINNVWLVLCHSTQYELTWHGHTHTHAFTGFEREVYMNRPFWQWSILCNNILYSVGRYCRLFFTNFFFSLFLWLFVMKPGTTILPICAIWTIVYFDVYSFVFCVVPCVVVCFFLLYSILLFSFTTSFLCCVGGVLFLHFNFFVPFFCFDSLSFFLLLFKYISHVVCAQCTSIEKWADE